jgi:hypothetical protein
VIETDGEDRIGRIGRELQGAVRREHAPQRLEPGRKDGGGDAGHALLHQRRDRLIRHDGLRTGDEDHVERCDRRQRRQRVGDDRARRPDGVEPLLRQRGHRVGEERAARIAAQLPAGGEPAGVDQHRAVRRRVAFERECEAAATLDAFHQPFDRRPVDRRAARRAQHVAIAGARERGAQRTSIARAVRDRLDRRQRALRVAAEVAHDARVAIDHERAQRLRLAVQRRRIPYVVRREATHAQQPAPHLDRCFIGRKRHGGFATDGRARDAGLHGEVEMQQHGIELEFRRQAAHEGGRDDEEPALRHVDRSADDVGQAALFGEARHRAQLKRVRSVARRREHRAELRPAGNDAAAAEDRTATAERPAQAAERIGQRERVGVGDDDPGDLGPRRERAQCGRTIGVGDDGRQRRNAFAGALERRPGALVGSRRREDRDVHDRQRSARSATAPAPSTSPSLSSIEASSIDTRRSLSACFSSSALASARAPLRASHCAPVTTAFGSSPCETTHAFIATAAPATSPMRISSAARICIASG